MNNSLTDKTLALAGLTQAVTLVQQVARQGRADPSAYRTCIYSVFQLEPPSTQEVYGGIAALTFGLEQVQRLLAGGRNDPQELEIVKYAVSVLHLERTLRKNPALLQRIGERIARARTQAEHFGYEHENVAANLADIYSETISTLAPRIMVSGEQGYLNSQENANRIRALLLAAIRSAVLWSQCGGGRLWLLLRRATLAGEARRLAAFLPRA